MTARATSVPSAMAAFEQAPPAFPAADLQAIARELFGLTGEIVPLVSERDQNARVKGGEGDHVLKIANLGEDLAALEFQQTVLAHLEAVAPDLGVPRIRPAKTGEGIATWPSADGRNAHLVRAVTYLPGQLFSAAERTSALLESLGRFMGRLSRALQGFGHPAAHRPDFLWSLDNAESCRGFIADIAKAEDRALVERIFARYAAQVKPRLPKLRAAVIHHDANDNNIIIDAADPSHVVGLIDFGDVLFGRQINELAVTLAYALLAMPDTIAAARPLIRSYHAEFPLSADELAVLFDLVAMRLTMSVCISSRRAKQYPDNEYLLISQKPAFELLRRLDGMNPHFLHFAAREAAGLEPVPAHDAIAAWLKSSDCKPVSVLPFDIGRAGRIVISLRSDAPGMEHAADPNAYWSWLRDRMESEGARYAIGLYGEDRNCYAGEQFKTDAPEMRSVHTGIDLFIEADTPIHAPLPGRVVSVMDNAFAYDYGPTVILEHRAGADGPPIYTLYGHLSRRTLKTVAAGQTVEAGQVIGYVGDPSVNGGWAPHVHVQIMTDLMGKSGNFEGAGEPSRWAIWRSICPNTNLLLRLDEATFQTDPTPPEFLLRRRAELLGPSLSISYRKKLKIVHGKGAYLYDHSGRAYLDCVNNICHVGHGHPKVVEALSKQAAILNTNTRYLHDTILAYADRIAATMPDPLRVVYFVCSGSEASELALRLARTVTGRKDTIVVDWGYHGNTANLVEVSPYKFNRKGGTGKPDHVHIADIPDPYRGPHKGYGEAAGRAYAQSVAERVADVRARTGAGPAAFIAESISGCGGQIVFPDGYLRHAFDHVRAAGGLCIADEVQVGFGRVGDAMWAYQPQGVVPDVVTLGKPMGNGHPLAAVVTTRAIADGFANGMEYFNSFGGNPVSCAVGMAVLDVIEQEGLQQRALETGNHLLERFRDMQKRHELIGDVRGRGMYLGIELVRDRATLEPATSEANDVINILRDRGVLVSTDGPFDNVLKLKPPIVFGRDEANILCEELDAALALVGNAAR
jgi:4-aminobutyrate aminotransferase-like enzyme/Ser/Thr protein kinase RdoA (MazF antagonist)